MNWYEKFDKMFPSLKSGGHLKIHTEKELHSVHNCKECKYVGESIKQFIDELLNKNAN